MADWNGYVAQVRYDSIRVDNQTQNYTLHLGEHLPSKVFEAGEMLKYWADGGQFQYYPDSDINGCAGW